MPLLILIHLFFLINLRFEAWPEMLAYPYLMNHGYSLYRDIINPYPPLFNWFLSGYFSLFGLSILNLKFLTWGIIIIIDLLIYFIAKKLYGQKPALIALGFYIIFQPLLDGNGLWYDLALVPLLLLAFYFQKPIFLSFAFFIKQSVIFLFILFFKSWKKFIVSFLALFAICYLPFAVRGIASDYLFWAWRFPYSIGPFMPGYKDIGNWRLWLIGLSPFIFFIFARPNKLLAWFLLSFGFLLPRFGLFHLQPALAFASVSLAQSIRKIKINRLFVIYYLLLACLMWTRHIKLYWRQPDRFFEPEAQAVAAQLAHHTSPSDKLLFLNVPSQYFVLADRLPVKPWADTFSWYLEIPGIQEKIIAAQFDKIIFSTYQNQYKFAPGSYIPLKLSEYKNKYFVKQTEISDQIFILVYHEK